MKVKVNQKELAKAINIVQKGISSKTTLPILNGILIEAKNNKLTLTGTDLELGIESNINCEIIQEGSIVITSRIFGDMIRKLPDFPVEIEVRDDNNVYINCGNSKFKLIGQSSVEYPQLPKLLDEISLDIPKDLLRTMIKQTVFATAQDETRPILTGALLEVNNNEAALVALDGYRLALKNIKINCQKDVKVVIPSKTLNELNKILDDNDADINVRFTSSHILFDLGNTVIISRLIEGQFLNYNDIIRNEYKSKVKVKTKDIQESIERASLLAREGKNNLVKLDITDENLVITSNSEIGDIHEDIPIELEGNDIKIAFNSKYILEGIKVIDSEEIEMNFVSNISPCILKPVGDDSYTYLILPVRLASDN
ncbi:DNA polymerase III subunit beta [Sporosalibacterium faouarense]|uniref:DNA polymerase III subunit beta n=1 Tax=Sporosalibacterium faouarense TaxID=516123 RepID=UPI00141CDA53|nr:DNA polymerase III subunit beta [Sporosalibacterium faouarense]MTI49786.1 DNA polymerase III subunit beta [Bacillota bacterium]